MSCTVRVTNRGADSRFGAFPQQKDFSGLVLTKWMDPLVVRMLPILGHLDHAVSHAL